jgi:hypothetical protein
MTGNMTFRLCGLRKLKLSDYSQKISLYFSQVRIIRAESRFLFQFLKSLAQNLYSVRWQLGPLAGSIEPSTMQAARHSL